MSPAKFEGDFSSFWHLQTLEPLRRLSWWWWWWLVMIPDPENPNRSKQLMVLWSTKDTERIWVSGHDWRAGGGIRVDDEGGNVFPGMVASWWFDGKSVHEPLVLREARMAALDSNHSLWPSDSDGEGGGAVVPLAGDDLSMGLAADRSHFWLRLTADEAAIAGGAPTQFDLKMTPWNREISALEYKHNMLVGNLGYDILRIHGTKCSGEIDGESVEGTAYFQKVCVQAPSIPWFWGMLHFANGSYLDWFMPHYSLSMTASDDRPWKLRDFGQLPITGAGQWKDAGRQRTEHFARCEVNLLNPEESDGRDSSGNPLPRFHIRMWNGRTQIGIIVKSAGRAHWTFDQPTRACLTSHFTYNEYPLEVEQITVLDEKGVRTLEDWEWVHGNAEHSWGVLH